MIVGNLYKFRYGGVYVASFHKECDFGYTDTINIAKKVVILLEQPMQGKYWPIAKFLTEDGDIVYASLTEENEKCFDEVV